MFEILSRCARHRITLRSFVRGICFSQKPYAWWSSLQSGSFLSEYQRRILDPLSVLWDAPAHWSRQQIPQHLPPPSFHFHVATVAYSPSEKLLQVTKSSFNKSVNISHPKLPNWFQQLTRICLQLWSSCWRRVSTLSVDASQANKVDENYPFARKSLI